MSTLASVYYCTDEDIILHAPSDYDRLVPPEWVLAKGLDGAFGAGDRWQLTSDSATFVSSGVKAGHAVVLRKGGTGSQSLYGSDGTTFVIASVDGETVLTLKRPGFVAGVGLPPGEAGGTSGVSYTVKTMEPAIEDESYNINRRFGIDDKTLRRKPTDIYDVRALEQLCVFEVLTRSYFDSWRKSSDDVWLAKGKMYDTLRKDTASVLILRWGSDGHSMPPDNPFSTRISR